MSLDGVIDLYVSGSGTLVRAMLADGLIDQLHLLIYPLTQAGGYGAGGGTEINEQAVARKRAAVADAHGG